MKGGSNETFPSRIDMETFDQCSSGCVGLGAEQLVRMTVAAAISSTMARPMLLPPHRVRKSNEFVLECGLPRPTLGKAFVSVVALGMERFDCTPNT